MGENSANIDKLLTEAQQGNRKAFREIYVIHYDLLMRYGTGKGYAEHLVHDAVQDLFIWLLDNPHKFARIQRLDLYLLKCLRQNLNATLARDQKKRSNATRLYRSEEQVEKSAEEEVILSENTEGQDEWLTRQLFRLTPHQREIIYLKYFENLSYPEIAEILSVSIPVARNSVFRAMRKLRKNAKSAPLLKRIYLLFF